MLLKLSAQLHELPILGLILAHGIGVLRDGFAQVLVLQVDQSAQIVHL